MSKSQVIRAAMSTTKEMSVGEIAEATGLPSQVVCTFLTCAEKRRKEVIKSGSRGNYRYRLDPDWQPPRKLPDEPKATETRERNPRKPAGTRKSIRDVADSVLDRAPVKSLAMAQLMAAGRNLRAVIREVVEDLEDSEQLVAALALHESAEQMVGALA